MKKQTLSLLLVIAWLIIPAAGRCDYAIHLKNGGRFLTPQYWQENQMIKFYIPGGVMGIEKQSVLKIDKIVDPFRREAAMRATAPGGKPAPEAPAEAPAAEKQPALEKKAAAADDANKDPVILGEFKALEKRFESRKEMTVAELTSLKNDLTALRDKIVTGRLKYAFLEEVNKLADMRFFTNDLLLIKSRNK